MVCPSWLSDDAKREWKRVMKEFSEMEADGQHLVTKLDRASLAAYCQAWADLKHATEMIEKHGAIFPIKDDSGRVKCLQQSPYVAMKHKAYATLKAYCAEFGFTPSARCRIDLPQSPASDHFDVFMAGKSG